jgi:hypothetical protein
MVPRSLLAGGSFARVLVDFVYGKCRTVPERIARVVDGMGETGYPVSEQDQEVSGAGPLVEAIKVPSGRHSAMMYPSVGGVRW